MTSITVVNVAISIVAVAAIIALVYVALRRFNVQIPAWVQEVFWIVVVAFVVILAILAIAKMWGVV